LKEKRIAFIFVLADQREKSDSLSEITLELRLVFEIADSGLMINGLIGGLKESVGRIHEEFLVNLVYSIG